MKRYIRAQAYDYSDLQLKYDTDFELFCDAVQSAEFRNRDTVDLVCTKSPERLQDASDERFRFIVSVQSDYFQNSSYFHNYIAYTEDPLISEYAWMDWYEWTPDSTEQDIVSDAEEIVSVIDAAIDKLYTKIDNLDGYAEALDAIVEKLEAAFPDLQVDLDPRVRVYAPKAYVQLVYRGDRLNDLKIDNVFQADISQIIKNMKRKLRRADQRLSNR